MNRGSMPGSRMPPSDALASDRGQSSDGSRSGPGEEQRQKARLGVSASVIVVPVLDGNLGRPWSGKMVNLSTCGIAVLCPQPLHPGASFFVGIPRSDGQRTWV